MVPALGERRVTMDQDEGMGRGWGRKERISRRGSLRRLMCRRGNREGEAQTPEGNDLIPIKSGIWIHARLVSIENLVHKVVKWDLMLKD